MKVSSIMNAVETVDPDLRLREAVKIMSEKGIGSLVIIEDKKILGIITERDVLKNVNRLDLKVEDIMSDKVITIDANESIDEAASLMNKYKIKRIPVTKKGILVGIITATDLIANAEEIEEDFFFE